MRNELEETIVHLREQLDSAGELDEAETAELKRLLEEISGTLDQSDVSSATLGERFHDHSKAFQESHPLLTQTVGRLADLLAQMGI